MIEINEIKPNGKRIAVKLDEEQKMVGGVIIPKNSRQKSKYGIIIAMSDECSDALKVGDRVLFHSNSGLIVKILEQDFMVMDEKEVFAVV